MGEFTGDEYSIVTDQISQTISKHLHGLRMLSLLSHNEVTSATLHSIGAGCPELKYLSIRYCMPGLIHDKEQDSFDTDSQATGFRALAAGCPQIEYLDLHGSFVADHQTWNCVLRKICKLPIQYLSLCNMTDGVVPILAHSLQRLPWLYLSTDSTKYEQPDMTFIADASSLVELSRRYTELRVVEPMHPSLEIYLSKVEGGSEFLSKFGVRYGGSAFGPGRAFRQVDGNSTKGDVHVHQGIDSFLGVPS